MAQLADSENSAGPIPVTTQLLAVAWLRWRMFVNGLRRPRAGTSKVVGLLLTILLRVIVWPILAFWVIGPAIACGVLGWRAIAHHHPGELISLLASVFVLWQFVSINGVSMSASTNSFDPASLVRFPLPFGRYLFLRTLLGLLTASTIAGCFALLATVIGMGVADRSLALPALAVLAVYALMNVFFARMLAAWLERWLATRRAREIFAAMMAFFFIGIQFLNLRRLPSHSQAASSSRLPGLLHASNQFLRWLPPGFAANSILFQGHPFARLAQFTALVVCTALFLVAFAIRLQKQFLGEYLSEGTPRGGPAVSPPRAKRLSQPQLVVERPVAAGRSRAIFSPVVAACLRKECFYVRGNTNQLIGMLMPLLFVILLSNGFFAHHPSYMLPGALGYVLFGILAGLYNIFGADGPGVQVYLLVPIHLRDVILAKNIASLTLILAQILLTWSVVLVMAKTPISLAAQISAAFWIVFVVGANLTVGTLRSIQAPRKFVPGQARQMRTPTNRTSSLLVLALLFGSILLQIPVTIACRHYGQPWLAVLIFAPLAVAAVAAYAFLLRHADRLILSNRDVFADELCRV